MRHSRLFGSNQGNSRVVRPDSFCLYGSELDAASGMTTGIWIFSIARRYLGTNAKRLPHAQTTTGDHDPIQSNRIMTRLTSLRFLKN
jgi:hypothetical protein